MRSGERIRRFAHPVAAGRELLRRLAELETASATFAVETTLSSSRYARRLRAWSQGGYRTTLHFIELPSADYAIERVADVSLLEVIPCRQRTSGGDSTADCTSLRPSSNPYRIGGIIGSATMEAYDLSTTTRNDDQELETLLEAARRATWDALHGPTYLRSGRFRPGLEDVHVVSRSALRLNQEAAQQGDAPDGATRRR